MKDYGFEIMKALKKEGFDSFTEEKADDVLESLEGFISDLAYHGFDYDAWMMEMAS